MMKKTVSILALLLFNCTLHHFKMNEKDFKPKKNTIISKKERIFLIRKNNQEFKSKNKKRVAESYNSDELRNYLRKGCCFEFDENSDLKIIYQTHSELKFLYPLTFFLWLGTLGVFPVFEEVNTEVKINVMKENQSDKEYKYFIQEKNYNSWLTIPISVLLFNNDSYKQSFLYNYDYPQELILRQFEKDYIFNNIKDINIGDQENNSKAQKF
ncbi:MAG: hypothetical protein KDK36_00005, partial [Leptospiraceae bacterium]|nr:hypothetical protein [Leptospiraceae bacterium]